MMVMVMSERDKGTWVNEEKENVTEKTCGGGELIIRKGCDWDSVETKMLDSTSVLVIFWVVSEVGLSAERPIAVPAWG